MTLAVLGVFLLSACSDDSANNFPTSSNEGHTPRSDATFMGQVGKVCDKFNQSSVNHSKATRSFSALYQACGNTATSSSGSCRSMAGIKSWIAGYMYNSTEVVNDLNSYGASLRLYNTGYGTNYMYIEECDDGTGLAKKR